ncbi:MAG TPA: hypothetical protein VK790_04715 [Solirubrobacteraceae bacterium]|nr:hypothetical protein [Solirubrobacteraceae bacterium]
MLDATGNLKAVQKLLGHASIQTTGDIYADWDIDQLATTMADVLAADEDDDETADSQSFPPSPPQKPANCSGNEDSMETVGSTGAKSRRRSALECAIAGLCRIGLRTLCVPWTRPAELLRSRLLVVTLDYPPRPLNRSRRPSQRLIAVQSRVVTGAVAHPHAVGRQLIGVLERIWNL